MRILLSGVLDRFPKLKIVLGHMGEGIPYWLWRIDYPYQAAPGSVAFMNTAPVTDAEREKLFHGNAERIFRIAPKTT